MMSVSSRTPPRRRTTTDTRACSFTFDAIDLDELRERIEDAWMIQAPKSLAKDYLAGKSPRDKA